MSHFSGVVVFRFELKQDATPSKRVMAAQKLTHPPKKSGTCLCILLKPSACALVSNQKQEERYF